MINTLTYFNEPLLGYPQIHSGYRLILPYDLECWYKIINFISEEFDGEGVVNINKGKFFSISHPRWAASRSQVKPNSKLYVIVDTLEPVERLLNLLDLKVCFYRRKDHSLNDELSKNQKVNISLSLKKEGN